MFTKVELRESLAIKVRESTKYTVSRGRDQYEFYYMLSVEGEEKYYKLP